ncbi:MAG: DNA-processing protein DprA [Propionibacteriaceae bacterium]
MNAATSTVRPRWSADRRARAGLSCAVEAGDPELGARLTDREPVAVWRQVLVGELGPGPAERAARLDLDEMQRRAELLRVRFVVPGDDEWPDGLADLGSSAGERRAGGPPVGLWLRGPVLLGSAMSRSAAVVGARACTAYGEGVAADLAAGLADAGVTVISGGAYGIDAAAHQGALGVGGCTVAVLACGVDVPYPRGNARLFDQLAREQLLVSELPPGAHPTRSRFLTRNRLIAALSQGVVVVEAAIRSGARNTAGWAGQCGRQLMAVPGPVHSALSEAPHQMIRDHEAVLVTSAAEVLELISPAGQFTLGPRRGATRPTDRLSVAQLAVFDALPPRRPASTDEVALASGLAVGVCLAELAGLEDAGLVRAVASGWRLV